MPPNPETALEQLWQEYSKSLKHFDDLSLARWMAQTLGQFEGQIWRFSHPLVGVYRVAAQIAHDRQIWFKRLVNIPGGYLESSCCRAPLLPFLTRDVLEMGLICQHCAGTAIPYEEIPKELQSDVKKWADDYNTVHDVAHWDDTKKKQVPNYQQIFEKAADEAEGLLLQAGTRLAKKLLDHYPAVVWEDQDECLDVRPEDIQTWKA